LHRGATAHAREAITEARATGTHLELSDSSGKSGETDSPTAATDGQRRTDSVAPSKTVGRSQVRTAAAARPARAREAIVIDMRVLLAHSASPDLCLQVDS